MSAGGTGAVSPGPQRVGRGSLESLLHQRLVVAVGPGGVGKTTISAAIAVAAARRGRNTLVLTIDPARRLADALGLSGLDDSLHEVDTKALEAVARSDAAAPPAMGHLYAAMLDTGKSFDALMARVSPTPEARERILNNRVYRAMAGTLARSHAYVAMERLHEVMGDPRFDLIVLDTPPTRNALDILDAPARLSEFLEESVITWFAQRSAARGIRGYLWNTGSAAAMRLLGLLAGAQFLDEIVAFFEAFHELRHGFRERAAATRQTLRAPTTAFVVVTSGDAANLDDAAALCQGIVERGIDIDAAVFNRSYEPLAAARSTIVADVGDDELESLTATLSAHGLDRGRAEALARRVANARRVAAAANSRVIAAADAFAYATPAHRVLVPKLMDEVRDLPGLAGLDPHLCPPSASPPK